MLNDRNWRPKACCRCYCSRCSTPRTEFARSRAQFRKFGERQFWHALKPLFCLLCYWYSSGLITGRFFSILAVNLTDASLGNLYSIAQHTVRNTVCLQLYNGIVKFHSRVATVGSNNQSQSGLCAQACLKSTYTRFLY